MALHASYDGVKVPEAERTACLHVSAEVLAWTPAKIPELSAAAEAAAARVDVGTFVHAAVKVNRPVAGWYPQVAGRLNGRSE